MLKSLLLLFVLPPINLLLLAITGALLQVVRPRIGRTMVALGLAGLLLFAMPAVAGALLGALEHDLPTQPGAAKPPAAIVVLGAEIMRTPDSPLEAVAGHLTTERLRTAAALHRKTGLPVLVTGGAAHEAVPPVGTVMAVSLVTDFGVPVRWVEAQSADTWENAALSAELLRRSGVTSIYVVTHPWHMKRALAAFAPTGLAITAAPTPLRHAWTPAAWDFVPRVSAWETSYLALHEWVGRAWYALR